MHDRDRNVQWSSRYSFHLVTTHNAQVSTFFWVFAQHCLARWMCAFSNVCVPDRYENRFSEIIVQFIVLYFGGDPSGDSRGTLPRFRTTSRKCERISLVLDTSIRPSRVGEWCRTVYFGVLIYVLCLVYNTNTLRHAHVGGTTAAVERNLDAIKQLVPPESYHFVPLQPPEILPIPFRNVVSHEVQFEAKPSKPKHQPFNPTYVQDVGFRQTANRLEYAASERSFLASLRFCAKEIVRCYNHTSVESSGYAKSTPNLQLALIVQSDIKFVPGMFEVTIRGK